MNNKTKIDSEMLPSDSWVKMILEIYAIWINPNNDFGVFIRPILVSYTNNNNYNYDFVQESEEEIEEIPDTEINDSKFFIKSDTNVNVNVNDNDSTTNLELNDAIRAKLSEKDIDKLYELCIKDE